MEFGFTLVVLVLLMAWHHDKVSPDWSAMAWLPAYFVLTMGAAAGMGLWLAGFNAHYRDVRQGLPVVIQMGFFSTPVLYPIELVRELVRRRAETLLRSTPVDRESERGALRRLAARLTPEPGTQATAF